MRQTWRWFGPEDTVGIDELLQVGVEGVVSALHGLAPGQVWTVEAIRERQRLIATRPSGEPSGIAWEVAESLPVSEDIKTQSADCAEHIAAYQQSLRNLATCGIHTVCYNFMPILDWTRTDLAARRRHGGSAMLFDLLDFAVFDLCILERAGAEQDYPAEFLEQARERFSHLSPEQCVALQNNIVAGLPGATDKWTVEDVRHHLASYADIDAPVLRRHLIDFLQQVVPIAEEVGINLCCHPDDPPFSLLGLPRIMSCEDDYAQVLDAVDSPNSGITFCTGSLGVNAGVDAVGFIKRLGHRIHFAHLRNTTRIQPAFAEKTSFYEAAHLEGDTDMVAVIAALLDEQARRRAEGRSDAVIPMRPDHGQDLLDDLKRDSMPGYPLIGRMRGLAELRGVIAGIEHARAS